MSYEPQIIVIADELRSKEMELEKMSSLIGIRKDKLTYVDFLLNQIQTVSTFDFKGMKLMLFRPELTSFNQGVRELLFEIGVDYGSQW